MRGKRVLSVERGMTFAGVGLAAVATGFAYLAIVGNDGVPKIGGAEHLAIFAMPSYTQQARLSSGVVVAPGASAISRDQSLSPIDYLPTATIKANPNARLQLLKVLKDRVVFQGPSGPVELRPGDFADGFGRLREIRMTRGRWVAVIVPEGAVDHNSR